MNFKLKKIDAVIIVALIIIAGIVLLKIDVKPPLDVGETPEFEFIIDEVNKKIIVDYVSEEVLWKDIEIKGDCSRAYLSTYVVKGDEITNCKGTITLKYIPTGKELGSWTFAKEEKPPSSIVPGFERVVTPEDEGRHYDKLLVKREWWTFTVVFDQDSKLPGWTATISFNHMALGDLLGTLKPDMMVLTLNSPDGNQYGGLVNKKRGGGIILQPTLDARSPGVDVTYEKSYAKGTAPKWHVHAEDKDIDGSHEIIMKLDYSASNSPIWIHSNRAFDKGSGSIAEYIFLGCKVNGTVSIDGEEYNVKGIGHHQHSWSSGLLKLAIKGWDWNHITLDNGWNIYYSNYYLSKQIAPTKTYKINPFSTVIITTDQGSTLTKLESTTIEIEKSDKLFLLLKMPTQTNVSAEAKLVSQFLLKTYDIGLNIEINDDNTFDKIWKFPTYVGMKIGRSTVTGSLTWSDEDGSHNVKLNGIGTIWNMRH